MPDSRGNLVVTSLEESWMTMTVRLRRVMSAAALAVGVGVLAVACSSATTPTVESTGGVSLETSDGGGDVVEESSDGGGETAEGASTPDVVLEQPETGYDNPLLVDPEEKLEEDEHEQDEAPVVEDGLTGAEADGRTEKDTRAVADALKKGLEKQPTTSDVAVLTNEQGGFDGFFLGSNVDEPIMVDVYPGTVILAANAGEPGKFVVAGYNAMGDEYSTSDTAFVVNVG